MRKKTKFSLKVSSPIEVKLVEVAEVIGCKGTEKKYRCKIRLRR